MARLTLLVVLFCSFYLHAVMATYYGYHGWGNHHVGYQRPQVFNCPPQHCPQQHCPQVHCPPHPPCPAPPAPKPCPPPPYHPPCPTIRCPPPPYHPPCPPRVVCPPPPICPPQVTCPTVPPTTPVTCAPEVKVNCTEESKVKIKTFYNHVQMCLTSEWQTQAQSFTVDDLNAMEELKNVHKMFSKEVLISMLTQLQSEQTKLTLENWVLELELEDANLTTERVCMKEELHKESFRLREIETALKQQRAALTTRYNGLVKQRTLQCQVFLKDELSSEVEGVTSADVASPKQQQRKDAVKKKKKNRRQVDLQGRQEVVDVEHHSQENEVGTDWIENTPRPPQVSKGLTTPAPESLESFEEDGKGFDCSLTIAVLQKQLLTYKKEIEIQKYQRELLSSCISMAIESESQHETIDIYSIYTVDILVDKLSLLHIQYKKTLTVNKQLHMKLNNISTAANVVCNVHRARATIARLKFDNFRLKELLLILNANVQSIIKQLKECSQKDNFKTIIQSSLKGHASNAKYYDDDTAKTMQDIGGRKYFINKVEKLTWAMASAACSKRGLQLVSLETPEEDKLVSAAITDKGWQKYWTDAVQLAVDSPVFVWDSTRTLLSYAPWSEVKHNETTSGPQCGLLGRWDSEEVAWHTADCLSQRFYICEQQ